MLKTFIIFAIQIKKLKHFQMFNINDIVNNNWKANKMADNYGYAVKGFEFVIEKFQPRYLS